MPNEAYNLDYRVSAAEAVASDRASFIRRVYMHLAGAILLLIGLEAVLLNTVDPNIVFRLMMGSQLNWFVVMMLFMAAGWVAQMWARSRSSVAVQYMGLGLYVFAWAVVMLPLLIVASSVKGAEDVIPQAGILTGAVFGGLTLAVFTTRKDFSFLGPVISVGFMIALGVIVCSMIFGFNLGTLFCFAIVALTAGSILFNTSKVMLHYPTDMHVAAALELFADVAMLFYYILIILLNSRSRD